MINVNINPDGFLVTDIRERSSPRTYACFDLPSLDYLIKRLTLRGLETYAKTSEGAYMIPGFMIARGLHIYYWTEVLGE